VTGAPRRTKIVRMIARLNVGGPARHVVWLTEALNDAEFETLLVTGTVPPTEQDMSDFAARHGVTPLVIKEMSREITPADALTVWKLYRLFVRERPDVVHTHTSKAGAVGRIAGLLYRFFTPSALIGRPRRVRFIHTFHGHVFHSYYGKLKTRCFLAVERTLAWLNTDRILVLSEQQLDEIHGRFRVGRAAQFRVVPLGLDLAACRPPAGLRESMRAQLGIGAGEIVVALIGRLTAIKNIELFLRVAAHFGVDEARFAIFGDGEDRVSLEQRARELGLGDRVLFAGTHDAAAIYGAIDIAALTSLNEGTPLTLIEAMANGRPVVSTAVGGVVDLLGRVTDRVSADGATYEIRERGVTVASRDERSYVAALRRLIADKPLQVELAARGKEHVERDYSKDRLVADIIAVTRELTA
jgi:glycosyltransferase involved in cell wall biosynthesis